MDSPAEKRCIISKKGSFLDVIIEVKCEDGLFLIKGLFPSPRIFLSAKFPHDSDLCLTWHEILGHISPDKYKIQDSVDFKGRSSKILKFQSRTPLTVSLVIEPVLRTHRSCNPRTRAKKYSEVHFDLSDYSRWKHLSYTFYGAPNCNIRRVLIKSKDQLPTLIRD